MIFSLIVFLFLLFPMDDLGDLVSVQVAEKTNQQVFLQFDHMNLSLLDFGISFDNISVETPVTPPISAEELTISPSFSSLIKQKPGGSINAKGFLNGEIDISMSPAGKSENGIEKQKISINAQSLNLTKLKELTQMPLLMKGKVNL